MAVITATNVKDLFTDIDCMIKIIARESLEKRWKKDY